MFFARADYNPLRFCRRGIAGIDTGTDSGNLFTGQPNIIFLNQITATLTFAVRVVGLIIFPIYLIGIHPAYHSIVLAGRIVRLCARIVPWRI